MSLGVVVVEAARRSGSLITARRAGDQGRPVYAVPGSPLDPRAEGTNLLIREGATLVTSANDVIDDIAPMAASESPSTPPAPLRALETASVAETADDSARAVVLEALSPSPVAVDDVMRFTGLRPAIVHLVLMELALAGRTQRHAGQRVSLVG